MIIRGGIHREIDLANAAARLAKLDPAKAWADEHFPNRPEVRGNSVFHATNAAGESIGTPPDEYMHKLGGTPCEYRPMGDWA
jgi:hypothetical protein